MKHIEKHIALDIDQTLNARLVKAHLTFYNHELGLGMTPREIEVADRQYGKVFDVPIIADFMQEHTIRFEEARAQVRESREVNMAFDPMPDAVRGVNTLYSVASGKLGYFTVRPYAIYGRYKAKETAVDWLVEKGFPNSEQTTICDSPQDKIAQVLAVVEQAGLPAILVDDNIDGPKGLLVASKAFSAEKLRNNLTFVGFGMDSSAAQALARKNGASDRLNVLGLASWQSSLVQGLIGQLVA